jgi:hypothetical protein
MLDRYGLTEFLLQQAGVQSERVARPADKGATGYRFASEEKLNANESFIPHGGDFI